MLPLPLHAGAVATLVSNRTSCLHITGLVPQVIQASQNCDKNRPSTTTAACELPLRTAVATGHPDALQDGVLLTWPRRSHEQLPNVGCCACAANTCMHGIGHTHSARDDSSFKLLNIHSAQEMLQVGFVERVMSQTRGKDHLTLTFLIFVSVGDAT